MRRRDFLKTLSTGAGSVLVGGCAALRTQHYAGMPNIVVIFTDDQGYADVGCFGAAGFSTPNLDRMAAQGRRFTNFYSAQAVCTASRAALMTGCYSNRINLLGALGPNAKIGIHDNEVTIAELLKPLGYSTAIFGKWHLGHHPKFLPTRHGFDEYFGLPYSNDMMRKERTPNHPPLPLIEGDTIIEHNPDQSQLTTWYTRRAVNFIERNQDHPFFLYVPHSMPHVPLHVSDRFKGKSAQGMYGDVISEIDWSVGEILATIDRLQLNEQTLVIFTSDNGPWLSYGDHAGSAKPLREGKGTTWDGGQREPCIMRWTGTIPAGTVCDEPAMTIDVLPTIARLTGAPLPNHTIDGKSIWPLMAGHPRAKSPHDALYFYWGDDLQAIRSGHWKLHFPHEYRTLAGQPGGTGGVPADYQQAKTDTALFDLMEDIGETTNIADRYPDIVTRLTTMAQTFDRELKATKRPSGEV